VPVRRLSPATRAGVAAIGILALAGGIGLLVAPAAGTAQRLGRIAGILILLGIAAVVVAALGRV
jgi:hypothetical protein